MGIQTIPNKQKKVPSLLSAFMTSIPVVPAVPARRNASLLSTPPTSTIHQCPLSMLALFACPFSKLCTSAFYLLKEALKSLHWASVPGTMAGGQVRATPHWEVLGGKASPVATHTPDAQRHLIFQRKNILFSIFIVWMSMLSQQY